MDIEQLKRSLDASQYGISFIFHEQASQCRETIFQLGLYGACEIA